MAFLVDWLIALAALLAATLSKDVEERSNFRNLLRRSHTARRQNPKSAIKEFLSQRH